MKNPTLREISISRLFFAVLISLLTFSTCSRFPDQELDKNNIEEAAFSLPFNPNSICSPVNQPPSSQACATENVELGSFDYPGSSFGTVEFASYSNNLLKIKITSGMAGLGIGKVKLSVLNDGSNFPSVPNPNTMMYSCDNSILNNPKSVEIPTTEICSCGTYALYVELVDYSNPSITINTWAMINASDANNPSQNIAISLHFCFIGCASGPTQPVFGNCIGCPVMIPNCGQTCFNLTKGLCNPQSVKLGQAFENAGPAFFFTWSNAATSPSIIVSPTSDATYSVDVHCAATQSILFSCTYSVNVQDLSAGSKGEKIWVCFEPPSKPGTWKNKKIKPSDLPLYIPGFDLNLYPCLSAQPKSKPASGKMKSLKGYLGQCGAINPCTGQPFQP